MPRTARIALPNYPHHVIQRGHNRQAVFADPDDYRYYLANLATWKTAYDCKPGGDERRTLAALPGLSVRAALATKNKRRSSVRCNAAN